MPPVNHTSYGSDRAELVYGLTAGGRMVHILEVERGLKCGCICPGCDRRLVARTKADKVVPHFAHYGPACGGAPETALHKLAKQIVADSLTLVVPKRIAIHGAVERALPGATDIKLESARIEYNDPDGIVPDLYVTVKGHELFVEMAVTHPCDEEKIRRIREHGIAAIEIDLSRIPRDAPPEIVADAVLRTAPRRWLFNKTIDDAVTTLREEERSSRIAAEKKLQSEVQRLIKDYLTSIASLSGNRDSVPRMAALRELDLLQHVGVDVAGYGCFSVPPAVWQAAVFTEVLLGRKMGKQLVKAVPIANYLETRRFIAPSFRPVSSELEAAGIKEFGQFAAPWRAVDAYLRYLVDAGVAVQRSHGFVLDAGLVERWTEWVLADAGRRAAFDHAVKVATWIISQVPDDERNDLTVKGWLATPSDAGPSYSDLLNDEGAQADISAKLGLIQTLFSGSRVDVDDLLHLPISQEIVRHLDAIAIKEAERKAAAAKSAEDARRDRCNQIGAEAAKLFGSSELDEWLKTPNERLEGRTPLEAGARRVHGLAMVKEILNQIERQRHTEAERAAEIQRHRDGLTRDAQTHLRSAAHSFLRDRNEDTDNLPPVIYCRDEKTYRVALRALGKLEQFLKTQAIPF
ncbi:MAG: DUF2384 domain-containing protein [Mesorhizobium sp.]|uniref:MbcA/ParS/Xre antitoxin family protein n=1 Tax=Mesorhizobium sp. TaxID=1871066 RepID=UPI001211C06D|nr:MbcA/ParS/Xre antitoxin family protein [Mesorhizobium sp.]TIT19134.1 MAG: DUF2384 domain-containing protein [Mesorhizobium sp.]